MWYYSAGGLCRGINVQISIWSRTIPVKWFRSGASRDQIQHLQHHGAPLGLRVFRKKFKRAPRWYYLYVTTGLDEGTYVRQPPTSHLRGLCSTGSRCRLSVAGPLLLYPAFSVSVFVRWSDYTNSFEFPLYSFSILCLFSVICAVESHNNQRRFLCLMSFFMEKLPADRELTIGCSLSQWENSWNRTQSKTKKMFMYMFWKFYLSYVSLNRFKKRFNYSQNATTILKTFIRKKVSLLVSQL